jgi:ribosome biogenesis GTPase / thiamine phosphate phosphatase
MYRAKSGIKRGGVLLQGRLVKAKGGFYFVRNNFGEVITCRARGKFKEMDVSLMVGDIVEADPVKRVIEKVYPRKNFLVRPSVANIDQAVVFMSVTKPEMDLVLLDRILISAEAAMLHIVICFNKIDLLQTMNRDKKIKIDKVKYTLEGCGYSVIFTSAVTGEGVLEFMIKLKDKVSVFTGPSGVGKSTFINKLKPDLELASAPVSIKTERGKHTTRHVELIKFDGDTFLVDTPGFQRLDLKGFSSQDLSSFFPEISTYQESCRFKSCLHSAEPQCAVKDAVQKEEMALWRYNHYLMFLNEIQQMEKIY